MKYFANECVRIGKSYLGRGQRALIVAELSGNHNGDFGRAIELVHAAKEAGADAVKLQTYTADTITMDSDKPYFRLKHGTIWDGETLYSLYKKAYTPWEWQPKLFEEANKLGLLCFSSPFDKTAVDFLEEIGVPAYKIASFEIGDIPLIRYVAGKGKPVIIATGIAEDYEIRMAVRTCLEEDNGDVVLLKCVSEYPTPYSEVNLRMMPGLSSHLHAVYGLSDHTPGSTVPIAAAALGASLIEKHLTLRRADGGPDAEFSMEPEEFADMVRQVRIAEEALGAENYFLTEGQRKQRVLRRSLFVDRDIEEGEELTEDNIRSIRPGYGIPAALFDEVIGKRAKRFLERGEPLKEGDFG